MDIFFAPDEYGQNLIFVATKVNKLKSEQVTEILCYV